MSQAAILKRQSMLILAVLFLAAAVCAAPWLSSSQTTAAPHTLTLKPHQHPYDPDWPDVYMILANKCTKCHRADNDERTDFTSYEALMAAKQDDEYNVVTPGKIEDSLLWEYVNWNVHAASQTKEEACEGECEDFEEAPDTPEMPPEKEEWLSAGQLQIIRRWIKNGALQFRVPANCRTYPVTEMDFPSARQCGGCHPKQFDEWSRSMHAYAQHSPVFEAFNLALIERTDGTIGTFCSRCHTPVGTTLGEPAGLRNVHRSQVSMEGVTCVVCHRRQQKQYKSSGRIHIEPGKLLDTCVYGPFDDPVSRNANAHDSKELPYLKSSAFCGECHDVTSPAGVRLEEAFSEWQNSPAARKNITCQACHMGPEPGVPIPDNLRPLGRAAEVEGYDETLIPQRRLTDHTFAGPDYSLLPDTEFPHKLDWMYETDYRNVENLTPYQQVQLKKLRKRNRLQLAKASQARKTLLRNGARIHVHHPKHAAPGQHVHLKVDVQSLISGHSFPTGFTAERQLWVAVDVRDATGRKIFSSGDFDHNGDLRDEHSHDVLTGKLPTDHYLLNFQSKFIALTNKGTERSVVLSVNRHIAPLSLFRPAPVVSASFGRPPGFRVSKGSLPPLKTVSRTYPFKMPANGPVHVDVRLNFRHLPPALLDHIGTPHLKNLLEVVVIDHYECDIIPSQ